MGPVAVFKFVSGNNKTNWHLHGDYWRINTIESGFLGGLEKNGRTDTVNV